ncbi:uncharacterized protein LOC126101364 [Schistocerca cancellata]|uniref:uncharacterized protein LOC126101364 n=1 Tax=Schistocerca cancellata TaxID=274614 RepID=UPI0021194C73|nr:uncharacterized protein LOC126101364 [Schistocerca cancellata]
MRSRRRRRKPDADKEEEEEEEEEDEEERVARWHREGRPDAKQGEKRTLNKEEKCGRHAALRCAADQGSIRRRGPGGTRRGEPRRGAKPGGRDRRPRRSPPAAGAVSVRVPGSVRAADACGGRGAGVRGSLTREREARIRAEPGRA